MPQPKKSVPGRWVYGDPNPTSWHDTAKILKQNQPRPKKDSGFDKITAFLEKIKKA